MDAHFSRAVVRMLPIALLLLCSSVAQGAAGYRTANFTVAAPTPQLAKEIGDTAERCRRELALEWLGQELPRWSRPCPIMAQVAPNLGAGGATSFVFDGGEVFGWRMNIQGSRERILDSVIPHEITHTIFASHFRQPLPRWADEGACTTVEHKSEIDKQERMLIEFLQTHRGIAFDRMFAMTEYPEDVLPLYAQGHSLAHYLISQRGKAAFLDFLADGLEHSNWQAAMQKHYEYRDLLTLQNTWLDWVRQGRPEIQLASNARPTPATSLASAAVVRGQDPASVENPNSSSPWASVGPKTPGTANPAGQVAPAETEVGSEMSVYEALSRGQLRR